MRRKLKFALAQFARGGPAKGATILIYHRVGGGTPDERDMLVEDFSRQLDVLRNHDVVSLDQALDRLDAGDDSPSVVLTFDDGFGEVYSEAWPRLRDAGMPFTIYLATAFIGGTMHWEGSTAKADGPALTWDELRIMVDSGLATVGTHTHHHARPEDLTVAELDASDQAVRDNLGIEPAHFTYPWGLPVPEMEDELRRRYRSVSTGLLGRNLPDVDRMRLCRVPVRGTDPVGFFEAKLRGGLGPEKAYAEVVKAAKRGGMRA